MPTRGPGHRAGLSRPAVLAAAHAVLAEEGVEGLTMRALARRLGVAPNALYSYVPSRTELVDALLDDVLAEVELPEEPDPVRAAAAIMRSSYEVLVTRPGLMPLYLARQGSRGPNAVRLGEVLDGLLARAGVAATDVPAARRALIVHAVGAAAFRAGDAVPAATLRDDFERSLTWLLTGMTGRA